jgi:hypothetical protein
MSGARELFRSNLGYCRIISLVDFVVLSARIVSLVIVIKDDDNQFKCGYLF